MKMSGTMRMSVALVVSTLHLLVLRILDDTGEYAMFVNEKAPEQIEK
jgi:hypothetical protein